MRVNGRKISNTLNVPSAAEGANGVWGVNDVFVARKTLAKWPGMAARTAALLVAGGGGGNYGGGGGAGGLVYVENITLQLGIEYAIQIGAGGAGNTNGYAAATNGEDTVFAEITAVGGGGGAGRSADSAAARAGSGGSGGGGGVRASSSVGDNGWLVSIGGQPSVEGQGYKGGPASPVNHEETARLGYTGGGSGGGGGAGGGGGSPQTAGHWAMGGHGGVGAVSNITGTDVYYAGGGGGHTDTENANLPPGTGGLGGGGNGAAGGAYGTAGSANLGGGGGTKSAGGSGVLILRSINPAAATTGSPTVTTDGNYTIYTFTGSGSITF
jgi:hypothetical protein